MSNQEIIYKPAVLDMFTVANEYCIFVENASAHNPADIYTYLHKVLPLLYLKGATLPDVDVQHPEANERFVTEEQWLAVYGGLKEKFGDSDAFLMCDPGSGDEEPAANSLAENLTDIYQDMKDFVLLFSKEIHAARENAVYEIARLFISHWGYRALKCQLHLHFLLYRSQIEGEGF